MEPVVLSVDNLVCDLDGVVYLGDEGIAGAGEALGRFDRAGVRIVFATNNSTAEPETVAARIARASGYRAAPHQVVTSSIAAADLLRGAASCALVVGESGITTALTDAGIAITEDPREADVVVVGLDRGVSYDRLRRAVTAVHLGARLVATNTDATYPTPDGPWPGGGAIVAAIERASGTTADVAGKPHRAMREAVVARLRPGRTAIVGDRPETDLALGGALGWTKVLVLSGVIDDPTAVPSDLQPDIVVGSLSDLVPATPA